MREKRALFVGEGNDTFSPHPRRSDEPPAGNDDHTCAQASLPLILAAQASRQALLFPFYSPGSPTTPPCDGSIHVRAAPVRRRAPSSASPAAYVPACYSLLETGDALARFLFLLNMLFLHDNAARIDTHWQYEQERAQRGAASTRTDDESQITRKGSARARASARSPRLFVWAARFILLDLFSCTIRARRMMNDHQEDDNSNEQQT